MLTLSAIIAQLCLSYHVTLVVCETENELVDRMLQHYDRRERPSHAGEPTVVVLDLFINSISSISEISMEYSINFFLRQTWLDPRLAHPTRSAESLSISLNHEYVHLLWRPDIVMKNEITNGDFHDITVPNILLSLSANGTLLYSQRISTKLSCYMLLHRFPFDKQTCSIDFESYGQRLDQLVFHWKNMHHPVQFNERMQLPEFNITGYRIDSSTASYVTGNFSSIKAVFEISRLYNYYIIQVYVPSILIVFLSWISFWIDIHAVPARTSVGLLTVLTATTQTGSVVTSLPKVSYVKAIDIWMFTSIVFVSASFLEYALVNVLARKSKHSKNKPCSKSDVTSTEDVTVMSETVTSCTCTGCQVKGSISGERSVGNGRARMVDMVSRLVFPLLYIVFNVGYWTYVYHSDKS